MFQKIDEKVKNLAVVIFLLECIGAIIGGIVVWKTADDYGFLLFLAIAGGGFITAWINALIVYAIGEAAEGTKYVRPLCEQEPKQESKETNSKTAPAAVTHKPDACSMTLVCPKCGTKNDVARVFCSKCGERLS